MKWVVYMLEEQGKFKTEEEAEERMNALEKTYKNSRLKFMVKEQ